MIENSIGPADSRHRRCGLVAAFLLTIAAPLTFAAGNAGADAVSEAVAAAGRPQADRARDGDREPEAVLRFFEIAPGQKVAELMTGRGYYADLLSRVVGPEGRVIAQNNAFVVKRFADGPLRERLANPELANVTRLDVELESLALPAAGLDAVLMILFYHDTYWQEVDRGAMNRSIFEALEPGGVFGLVDHHAEAGSGSRDVKTLHRVDAELVKGEILEAGFVLEAESDVLRHTSDDRTGNVFDPGVRGKTDRFVYRFRKPVKAGP